MLIAQLTDLHCTGQATVASHQRDNDTRATAAVATLVAEQPAPDLVLGTGDLTCDGEPEHLAGLLRVVAPLGERFLPLPGNHDAPDQLKAAFPTAPWARAGHASWSVAFADVHLIGLDSTARGYHGGDFDAPREDWLRAELAATEAPVLLAIHHPPVASGIEWMDLPFRGVDRLAACLADFGGRVAKIVCGHLHRPLMASFAGVPVQAGLATAIHVALDLRPGAPPAVVDEPFGYQLHRWHAGSWVAHTRYVTAPESGVAPGP